MYNKQQHAVPAYVQQAVYSSNEQCSKQEQQQRKQAYSYLQQAPAPQNYYYCMYAAQVPAVAAHLYLHCRIQRKASSSRQRQQLAKALLLLLLLFVVGKYRYNIKLVRAHAPQYTESLLVYPPHTCNNAAVIFYSLLYSYTRYPGISCPSMNVKHIHIIYACIQMCTRITRTGLDCSRFCVFHTNPARVRSRKTCPKKT